MRIVIVGGEANQPIKETFANYDDIVISNTFQYVTDLEDDIYDNGITFLNNVDSILVLDYGFDVPDSHDRVKQFVELQDAINVSGLTETKLYLVTKDSDIYTGIQSNIDGVPGIIYLETIVLAIEGEYKSKILYDILKGKRDRVGLYHPDADKVTMHSRMEEDKNLFIENSRSVSEEVLKYGQDAPVSLLSKKDYVDSEYTEKRLRREELERKRELERKKKGGKKGKKRRATPEEEEEFEPKVRVRKAKPSRGYEDEDEYIDYIEDGELPPEKKASWGKRIVWLILIIIIAGGITVAMTQGATIDG